MLDDRSAGSLIAIALPALRVRIVPVPFGPCAIAGPPTVGDDIHGDTGTWMVWSGSLASEHNEIPTESEDVVPPRP
jgi:hypothetical protein